MFSHMVRDEVAPMLWPDDSPRVRASDPVSSHEAADATSGSVAASQLAVARIFENENKPMTALEVEQKATQYGLPYSVSRVRSCLSELEARGALVRDGFVRREGDKRRRQLWALSGVVPSG